MQDDGLTQLVNDDGTEPNVDRILDMLEDAGIKDTDFLGRLRDNEDTRFCFWSGQSEDGRKHAAALGEPAQPWEGASDTRVRVVDRIVEENVMKGMTAFRKGRMQVNARGQDDHTRAHNANEALRYMTRTLMGGEVEDELEHAIDWRETFGLSLLEIGWKREEQLVEATATMEELESLAAQAGLMEAAQEAERTGDEVTQEEAAVVAENSAEDLRKMIHDPRNEAALVEMLKGWSEAIDTARAKRMLRELKQNGATTYPVPEKTEDRAQWTALMPMRDVFFPAETCRLQDARWVARLEWLGEAELRNREVTEGWDRDFIDKAWRQKGVSFEGTAGAQTSGGYVGQSRRRGSTWRVDDVENMTQIMHVWYKVPLGSNGRVAVFRTVMHAAVKDAYGVHEQSPYAHGKYPFVALRREKTDRRLLESRGVPEIVRTWQSEIKKQRDSRYDRTDLATLPPLVKPQNWGGGSIRLGPAAQIPERRANTVRWLPPPAFDKGSIEAEASILSEINEHFGRHTDDVSPVLAALRGQHLVDGILSAVREAMRMTFQLMQQWMSPMWIARVGGAATEGPMEVTRADIQGQFDFEINFDSRDLDVEFVQKKLELIATMVAPLDTSAVLDRATLVEWAMRAIDAQLAEQTVRPQEAATQDEIEDEKRNMAMILSGVEPEMREGQNHALRLQVMEETLKLNPEIEQYVAESEPTQQMLAARAQHHQHMLEQEQNKMIGRVGAKPGLAS